MRPRGGARWRVCWTGAQLVRNASDGETAAVYLAHGRPVHGDDLAGRYSNPSYARLDSALADVRRVLCPVFDAAADAHERPRPLGGPNVSRGVLEKIAQLHRAGLRPEQIAPLAGVARATAYRRVAALMAADAPGPLQAQSAPADEGAASDGQQREPA